MRYPKSLPAGGTIGLIAPSFGCAGEPYRSAFDNALQKWRDMGYRTLLGRNCYAGDGVGISSTPESCGREAMEMFLNEEADCIVSCGGGELMCEILPYVDFDKLASVGPKWFMGYSDNTNLTYLLATLCDTAAVYGPCASTFGMEPWHESLKDAMGILTGERLRMHGYDKWEKEKLKSPENPLAPYHVTEPRQIRSYVGQCPAEGGLYFQGRLLGGCMDCLMTLLGTCFDKTAEFAERYQEDGIIWFLESCDLNVFSIRRAMWQMEQAGWFHYVKGFLIGRPLNGEAIENLDAYSAVLAVAGNYNVPVVMDVDLGHLPPMMPLVVGSMAEVSVLGNEIEVAMKFQ